MDTSNWDYYTISELFSSFERGKVHSQSSLPQGDDYFYVGAKKDANGVMCRCGYDANLVSKGNCLVFICNGEGSVGYCNYMDRDFMASGDLILAYADYLNPRIGLFMASLLDLERPKYSFGRKYGSHVKSTKILLPSKDGSPDWQYLEDFIKDRIIPQLPKKAQKVWLQKYDTKPQKQEKMILNTEEWQWFKLKDFCNKPYKARAYNANELIECEASDVNSIRYITRTDKNNGCKCYVQNEQFESIEAENAITIGDTTATVYYQESEFICGDHMVIVRSKHFNRYTGLFISCLLNREKYRYNYGRAFTMEIIEDTDIKLPAIKRIVKGKEIFEPDWQFMEDYIKSLPYSKNIEPSDPKEVVDELVEMKKEMIKMRRQMEAINTASTVNIIGSNVTYLDQSKTYNVK